MSASDPNLGLHALQIKHGGLAAAVRFSPCSRLLCFYTGACNRLMVLNTKLESMYEWPDAQTDSGTSGYGFDGVVHTWTPSGILMGTARLESHEEEDPPAQPPNLEACWHKSMPDPWGSTEAALVMDLVEDFSSGQILVEMSCGPAGGLAALVKIQGEPQGQYKLHLLLPNAPKVSKALVCNDLELAPVASFSTQVQHAVVQWSPAGERVLVDAGSSLMLLTPDSSCLLRTQKHWQTNAAFDPSGCFVAAVCCSRVLHRPTEPLPGDQLSFSLYGATDGALRFSQVMDSPPLRGRLSFSSLSDQLVLAGAQGIHIISIGQACKPSMNGRHSCDAIVMACTWVSVKIQSDDKGLLSASCLEAPHGDVEEAMQLG